MPNPGLIFSRFPTLVLTSSGSKGRPDSIGTLSPEHPQRLYCTYIILQKGRQVNTNVKLMLFLELFSGFYCENDNKYSGNSYED